MATVRAETRGIGAILGSGEKASRASLRRTFSADMSSKKWLAQTMKKIPSSEEICNFGGGDDDEEQRRRREEDLDRPGQFDIWSAILAQKEKDAAAPDLPPYVHPLVKRSSSSLSQKSLEICTESLGSETGSDGFSSGAEEDDCPAANGKESDFEAPRAVTEAPRELPSVQWGKLGAGRRVPAVAERSFPPPLPTISRGDAPRIHMQPHREDGRLVLRAVAVASRSCLRAERRDGRLRLTLVNPPSKPEETQPRPVQEIRLRDDAAADGEEVVGERLTNRRYVLEVKLHKSVINNLMNGIPFNRNPWAAEKKKFDDRPEQAARVSATVFNSYECGWKRAAPLPAAALQLTPPRQLMLKPQRDPPPPPSPFSGRSCKEPRRTTTFFIWNSYCIATT